MFAFSDLIKPVTREQARASIYDVLGIIGVATTTWKAGAVVRTMITAWAVVLSSFSEVVAKIARSGFLELAEGPWLDLVAWYVFGEKRNPANFATGFVTLTNATGSVYTVDPEDLVVGNPDTKKIYRNTLPFTLGILETITIPITAVEAGSGSNAIPGSITKLETPLSGVTVTNAIAVVGSDEEEDPELRTRCLEKIGSFSPNGPADAYAYAARTARRVDGSLVGVTRVRSTKDGYGNTTVVVADPSGSITGVEDDPLTDLGAVSDRIQKKAGPLCATITTESATDVVIPVAGSVWVYTTANLSEAEVQTRIAEKLLGFIGGQPIGGNRLPASADGYVYHDAIKTAAGAALPDAVRNALFHCTLTDPPADVLIAPNGAPVLGPVAFSVILVEP